MAVSLKLAARAAEFVSQLEANFSALIPVDTKAQSRAEFDALLRRIFESLDPSKLRHALLTGFQDHATVLWQKYVYNSSLFCVQVLLSAFQVLFKNVGESQCSRKAAIEKENCTRFRSHSRPA